MTPLKTKDPSFCATKEPIGMVVAKQPTWSVTGCVTGLIAGAVLLKVILDPNPKASWLGVPPNWIASRALKVRKGTPGGGGS